MNCSGGPHAVGQLGHAARRPSTGPDVGPDFTGVSNIPLTKRHGFIFEVPAGGRVDPRADHPGRALRARGRGLRPARAGVLYMTEDNFGFPSGLYRYTPRRNPLRSRPPRPTTGACRCWPSRACPRPTWPPPSPPGASYRVHVGRHRRPGAHLPVHPRPDRPDHQRHRPSTTSAARAGPRARPGSPGSRAPPTTGASSTSARPRAAAPPSPGPATRSAAGATAPARSGPTTSLRAG